MEESEGKEGRKEVEGREVKEVRKEGTRRREREELRGFGGVSDSHLKSKCDGRIVKEGK